VSLDVPADHAMTAGVPQFNAKTKLLNGVVQRSSIKNMTTSTPDSMHKQESRVSFDSSFLHGRLLRYPRS
jgi:hypothetical protein